MAEIRAVLFDKDGTLIDFHTTWSVIARELALEAAGGDAERAALLLKEAGYDPALARFRPDSVFAAGTNADVVALWYPHLDRESRAELLARFDREAARRAARLARLLPGVAEALGELHRLGLRLGLATNDSTGSAEQTLRALAIASHFDAVFGYDAVANPKPAPDVVHAFAELAGLKPAQIAVVGDNRHDLATARAAQAGLAVGVLSGTGTRESLAPLADIILESAADLPAYLASAAG
jgi:phosphoglycolate phosphatase